LNSVSFSYPSAGKKPSGSLVTVLVLAALLVFTLTRFVLWLVTGPSQMSMAQWGGALGLGLAFDLATLAFLVVPFWLTSLVLPQRWRTRRWYELARWVLLWMALFALIFGAVAEVVFWLEFSTRFNFIAVDYLIYTHEVIGNIKESYPVGTILGLIAAVVSGIVLLLRRQVSLTNSPRKGTQRWMEAVMLLAFPVLSGLAVSIDDTEFSDNAYANELAGNGLYGFASAMRRNDLDYDKFYAQIDQARADAILVSLGVHRAGLASALSPPPGAQAPMLPQQSQVIAEALKTPFLMAPRNVVLVSVESLSAAYSGAYGGKGNLTPQIDALAKKGMLLSRLFATGTRTVRGLEALSLGTPPVPGQAIVHRPHNDQLQTLGQLLRNQGFDTHWIYGGYGYFDNMNAFFKGNGHAILDRTDFSKDSIAGENIWGVADESLFDNAFSALDQSHAHGKRFFAHVMTTSNHRPYTFPAGRVVLPEGSREAAVQYTDYAIGRFLSLAKAKPWFKDTLFVVVADHCASVAGKSKLPVESYLIVGFLYGPELVRPSVHSKIISQIDIPPSLLDFLGAKGSDQFFGQSLIGQAHVAERAFISNYQELGYYKNDKLIVLSPKRKVQMFSIDPVSMQALVLPTVDAALAQEAIAYYQTASRSFKGGYLKAKMP
jgi:phosphoglycerol transferase MdoB-like AlkP superfamily enzyme